MTERIYDEEEVHRILSAATAIDRGENPEGVPAGAGDDAPGPAATPAPRRGLTLGELREIGAEAGIDPDRISTAARALDRPSLGTRREVGPVGRTRRLVREIPLAGPFQGEDWDRVVVLLRSRFGGPGEVATEGSLRSWSHAGVQAFQEPDPEGEWWRLRVELEPSEIHESLELFGLLGAAGAVLAAVGILTDAPMTAAYLGSFLLAGGGAGGGWILGRSLPRWAGGQEAELEALAHQISRIGARREAGTDGASDS